MRDWFSHDKFEALKFHPRHFHDYLMDQVGFVDFKRHELDIKDRHLTLYYKAGPIDEILPKSSLQQADEGEDDTKRRKVDSD